MKQMLFMLTAFGLLIMFSCQKEDFSLINSQTDEELVLRSNQIPNGLGIQKINDKQTGSTYKGQGVGLPYWFDYDLNINAGTWVTLAYNFNRNYYGGDCSDELTDEIRDELLENAISHINNINLQLFWDDNPLDVSAFFRPEYIELYEEDGNCKYRVPWRYYVVPQKPGAYTFLMKAWYEGEWSRDIIWESGNK